MKWLPEQAKPLGIPRGCWLSILAIQVPILILMALFIHVAQTDLESVLRWAERLGL